MTETFVSRGFLFHKSVNSTVVVQPGKDSFHFPPLIAVSPFPQFNFAKYLELRNTPKKRWSAELALCNAKQSSHSKKGNI
jgi:hypothetical protein